MEGIICLPPPNNVCHTLEVISISSAESQCILISSNCPYICYTISRLRPSLSDVASKFAKITQKANFKCLLAFLQICFGFPGRKAGVFVAHE